MNYDQFLKKVTDAVQEKMGVGYHVRLQSVRKNNGVVLNGLSIREKNEKTAPTIYMEQHYMCYEQGTPFDTVLEEIISLYKENRATAFEGMAGMADFKNVKDRVVYKLIQIKGNEELLDEIPYAEFLNLAVVFYLLIGEEKNCRLTALIYNSHMSAWGVTKEELFALAEKNSPRLLPVQIKSMAETMVDMFKDEAGEVLDEFIDDFLKDGLENPMYVLTNECKMNGAACVLYKDVLKEFADNLKNDIIIIPSSIHELLLLADKGINYSELEAIVRDINANEVPREDVLSDSVYKYDRDKDQIVILGEVGNR